MGRYQYHRVKGRQEVCQIILSVSQNSNEPLTSRMGLKGGGHGWPRSLEFWDRLFEMQMCVEDSVSEIKLQASMEGFIYSFKR